MINVHLHPAGAGEPVRVQGRPGQSLMQAAVAANAPGIVAECGGTLTCATCHVYVREPFLAALPAPSPDELSMLDYTAAPRQANSRLSCQVMLEPALDGLAVDLPPTQI